MPGHRPGPRLAKLREGRAVDIISFRRTMVDIAGAGFELELTEGAAIIIAGFAPVTVMTTRGPLELWEDLRSNIRRYYSRAEVMTRNRYRQLHGEGPHNVLTGPLPPPLAREEPSSGS
jgi:hypothetical protein